MVMRYKIKGKMTQQLQIKLESFLSTWNFILFWTFSAKPFPNRSSLSDVFLEKVFSKYAVNWQENTHAEVWCQSNSL